MNILAFRSETSNDIITNLFTGYIACTDKRFVEYMKKCKDSYEEGEDFIYQFTMQKAKRKYQARVVKNEWNTIISNKKRLLL
jgi:hypothetical protein